LAMFTVWMKTSSVVRIASRPLSCWDEAIAESGGGSEERAWDAGREDPEP
jgi:hypothetical protein